MVDKEYQMEEQDLLDEQFEFNDNDYYAAAVSQNRQKSQSQVPKQPNSSSEKDFPKNSSSSENNIGNHLCSDTNNNGVFQDFDDVIPLLSDEPTAPSSQVQGFKVVAGAVGAVKIPKVLTNDSNQIIQNSQAAPTLLQTQGQQSKLNSVHQRGKKRCVNENYGIFYNITGDSESSFQSNPSSIQNSSHKSTEKDIDVLTSPLKAPLVQKKNFLPQSTPNRLHSPAQDVLDQNESLKDLIKRNLMQENSKLCNIDGRNIKNLNNAIIPPSINLRNSGQAQLQFQLDSLSQDGMFRANPVSLSGDTMTQVQTYNSFSNLQPHAEEHKIVDGVMSKVDWIVFLREIFYKIVKQDSDKAPSVQIGDLLQSLVNSFPQLKLQSYEAYILSDRRHEQPVFFSQVLCNLHNLPLEKQKVQNTPSQTLKSSQNKTQITLDQIVEFAFLQKQKFSPQKSKKSSFNSLMEQIISLEELKDDLTDLPENKLTNLNNNILKSDRSLKTAESNANLHTIPIEKDDHNETEENQKITDRYMNIKEITPRTENFAFISPEDVKEVSNIRDLNSLKVNQENLSQKKKSSCQTPIDYDPSLLDSFQKQKPQTMSKTFREEGEQQKRQNLTNQLVTPHQQEVFLTPTDLNQKSGGQMHSPFLYSSPLKQQTGPSHYSNIKELLQSSLAHNFNKRIQSDVQTDDIDKQQLLSADAFKYATQMPPKPLVKKKIQDSCNVEESPSRVYHSNQRSFEDERSKGNSHSNTSSPKVYSFQASDFKQGDQQLTASKNIQFYENNLHENRYPEFDGAATNKSSNQRNEYQKEFIKHLKQDSNYNYYKSLLPMSSNIQGNTAHQREQEKNCGVPVSARDLDSQLNSPSKALKKKQEVKKSIEMKRKSFDLGTRTVRTSSHDSSYFKSAERMWYGQNKNKKKTQSNSNYTLNQISLRTPTQVNSPLKHQKTENSRSTNLPVQSTLQAQKKIRTFKVKSIKKKTSKSKTSSNLPISVHDTKLVFPFKQTTHGFNTNIQHSRKKETNLFVCFESERQNIGNQDPTEQKPLPKDQTDKQQDIQNLQFIERGDDSEERKQVINRVNDEKMAMNKIRIEPVSAKNVSSSKIMIFKPLTKQASNQMNSFGQKKLCLSPKPDLKSFQTSSHSVEGEDQISIKKQNHPAEAQKKNLIKISRASIKFKKIRSGPMLHDKPQITKLNMVNLKSSLTGSKLSSSSKFSGNSKNFQEFITLGDDQCINQVYLQEGKPPRQNKSNTFLRNKSLSSRQSSQVRNISENSKSNIGTPRFLSKEALQKTASVEKQKKQNLVFQNNYTISAKQSLKTFGSMDYLMQTKSLQKMKSNQMLQKVGLSQQSIREPSYLINSQPLINEEGQLSDVRSLKRKSSKSKTPFQRPSSDFSREQNLKLNQEQEAKINGLEFFDHGSIASEKFIRSENSNKIPADPSKVTNSIKIKTKNQIQTKNIKQTSHRDHPSFDDQILKQKPPLSKNPATLIVVVPKKLHLKQYNRSVQKLQISKKPSFTKTVLTQSNIFNATSSPLHTTHHHSSNQSKQHIHPVTLSIGVKLGGSGSRTVPQSAKPHKRQKSNSVMPTYAPSTPSHIPQPQKSTQKILFNQTNQLSTVMHKAGGTQNVNAANMQRQMIMQPSTMSTPSKNKQLSRGLAGVKGGTNLKNQTNEQMFQSQNLALKRKSQQYLLMPAQQQSQTVTPKKYKKSKRDNLRMQEHQNQLQVTESQQNSGIWSAQNNQTDQQTINQNMVHLIRSAGSSDLIRQSKHLPEERVSDFERNLEQSIEQIRTIDQTKTQQFSSKAQTNLKIVLSQQNEPNNLIQKSYFTNNESQQFFQMTKQLIKQRSSECEAIQSTENLPNEPLMPKSNKSATNSFLKLSKTTHQSKFNSFLQTVSNAQKLNVIMQNTDKNSLETKAKQQSNKDTECGVSSSSGIAKPHFSSNFIQPHN